MSPQVLSPVTAPTAPTAPQGTAAADASGFKGALSTALDAANDTDAPQGKKTAGAKPRSDDGSDAAGFLVAPSGLPAPQTVPVLMALHPAAPGAGEAGEDVAATAPVQAATDPLPAADGTPSTATADGGPAEGAPPAPSLETGKGAADSKGGPKADPLLIKPPLPVANAFDPSPTAPVDAAKAEDAARAVAALEAVAKAAPAASPTPAPAAAPIIPPPAPASLRPLAERTRLATDAPTDAAAGEPAPAVAATGATTAATVTVVSDQPVARPEAVAAVAREILPMDAPADEDASQGLAPLDGGPVAQTAHAAAHDISLSQTSRASIDATAQIAAQIVRKLEGRSTRFEMALTPDDLGRVDVKLDIDADGRLAARLAFDNPLAATDLKARADELRRQLQDAGFQLSDNALEFADRDSSSSAFDRGGDARQGQSRAFAAASRLNAETDVAQPPRWMSLNLSPSGVDLKV